MLSPLWGSPCLSASQMRGNLKMIGKLQLFYHQIKEKRKKKKPSSFEIKMPNFDLAEKQTNLLPHFKLKSLFFVLRYSFYCICHNDKIQG